MVWGRQVRSEDFIINPLARPRPKPKKGGGQSRKRGREEPAEPAGQAGVPGDTEGALAEPVQETRARVVARPSMLARGHTGFLTFARKPVSLDGEE